MKELILGRDKEFRSASIHQLVIQVPICFWLRNESVLAIMLFIVMLSRLVDKIIPFHFFEQA